MSDPMYSNYESNEPSGLVGFMSRKPVFAAVIILVLGLIIGGLFGGIIGRGTAKPDSADPVIATATVTAPGPTATVSVTVTPTETPSPSSQPSTSDPSPASGGSTIPPGAKDLSIKDNVDIDCHPSYAWSDTTATITQTFFRFAFACKARSAGQSSYVDFVVPPGATSFQATVGQDDHSERTDKVAQFEVLDGANNASLWKQDVKYGEATPINVPLNGVVRIRLLFTVTTSTNSGTAIFVWAEPKFA